jgi:predicted nucleotidyltransferase
MFQKLLRMIANELNTLRMPYMVIGGQAVLLYGEPRLTKDIDITLGVGVEELEKIKNAVQKLALRILVDNPEEFVKKTMVLPVMDDKTGIRVDFIFSFSLYEKQAIERAFDVKFGTTAVKFASLEDVVIHKIVAGRGRDIEDVKAILLKNPNYNVRYIQGWLKEFDKSLNESFSAVFHEIEEEIK